MKIKAYPSFSREWDMDKTKEKTKEILKEIGALQSELFIDSRS